MNMYNNTEINPIFSYRHSASPLNLNDSEVHLWRIIFDDAISHLQSLNNLLSADEKIRAGRYCFEKDRDRFIITRGLLRVILGRYLTVEPQGIYFDYNAYGKPGLNANKIRGEFQFNVSHSDSMALIGVSRNQKVGVDIEKMRPDVDMFLIAERFFSEQEIAKLKTIAEDSRQKTLWEFWACKEAFVKAIGRGLSFPLDEFDIFEAVEKTVFLTRQLDTRDEWSIVKCNPYFHYAGALVVEGALKVLHCWDAQGIIKTMEFSPG